MSQNKFGLAMPKKASTLEEVLWIQDNTSNLQLSLQFFPSHLLLEIWVDKIYLSREVDSHLTSPTTLSLSMVQTVG